MKEYSMYVGMDVDKCRIAIAEAQRGDGKPVYRNEVLTDTKSIDKMLERYEKERTKFCYEAGPTGYGLQRYLSRKGYECVVVAPSLIPKRAGDRIKTNRRDAVKLAGLLRAGELTAIFIPTEAQEAVRDLTRAREDAKTAEKKAKLVLGAFLLRHEIRYAGKTPWSNAYMEWLRTLKFPFAHQQVVFEEYVESIRQNAARVEVLEKQMEALYETWELKGLCDSVMALRGLSLIAAMTVLAELGDLRRFESPRELMAYLGLVPSESSTGDTVKRGGITKTGNTHVRRVLIESSWSCRLTPRRTKHWNSRAKNAPDTIRTLAWQAMLRLHQRYWRLSNRGLPRQKVVVAVARELAAFIWAVAREYYRLETAEKKAA